MTSRKITIPKQTKRFWHQVDPSQAPMGRIATSAVVLLRGKHKRDFTPHMDLGDFVVAINVDKLQFTGRKISQKKYYHHSGYLGGRKTTHLKDELNKNSGAVLRRAVYNMLDDLKFRKKLIARLKLIKGNEHNYKIDKIW